MHKQRLFSSAGARLSTAAPLIALAFSALLVLPFSAQVADTTPPTLTALSFIPSTIDTSSANAAVDVKFSTHDNLSGVVWALVEFVSRRRIGGAFG